MTPIDVVFTRSKVKITKVTLVKEVKRLGSDMTPNYVMLSRSKVIYNITMVTV